MTNTAKIIEMNAEMTGNDLVDFAVLIGRFQCFHIGHEGVFEEAFRAGKKAIAVIGSAESASDISNPFSYALRKKMIISRFRKEYCEGRLLIVPMRDYTYRNGVWQKKVVETVNKAIRRSGFTGNPTVGLVGFLKDQTSDYLNWFPNWKQLLVHEHINGLNAADIRHPFFADGTVREDALSPGVVAIMKRFKRTSNYRRLVTELAEISHCKTVYGPGPFQTSDMLIEYRDQMLAITRGGKFGFGLKALPGGINDGEDPIDCAMRELDEEVQMLRLNPWLTDEMLRSWIVATKVFDKPGRDARGNYITTVVHIRIPDHVQRPIVKGDDDARAASFIPKAQFKRRTAFADHFHIVDLMLGINDQLEPQLLAA